MKREVIHHIPRNRRDPAMEFFYDEFNKKYFRNKLPQVRVSYSKHLGHMYGCTLIRRDGKPFVILLNRVHKSWLNLSATTLLHEMIHVKLTHKFGLDGLGHGRRFKKERRRLIKIGAFTELI